jgi:hypothetical protein
MKHTKKLIELILKPYLKPELIFYGDLDVYLFFKSIIGQEIKALASLAQEEIEEQEASEQGEQK